MPNGRFVSWIAAIAALAGALLLSSSGGADAGTSAAAVRTVRVALVDQDAAQRELSFSGITRAATRARLAFTVGGRLAVRPVAEGDRVSAGELLARLDDRELENAVSVARASLARLDADRGQVQRDVERVEKLVSSKAATAEELERSRAALEAILAAERMAQARLAEAERLYVEARLFAPFDGTVVDIGPEPGENVTPGQTVLALVGDGRLEVEIEVPESVASTLVEGSKARVAFPAASLPPTTGRVARLSRSAIGPGRLFPVVVELEGDDALAAGWTAQVSLLLPTATRLSVPVAAIVDPGGHRPSVFVVRDGRAYRVPVEVVALRGDWVAVAADLAPGDRIVVGGQRGLLDGDAVELAP